VELAAAQLRLQIKVLLRNTAVPSGPFNLQQTLRVCKQAKQEAGQAPPFVVRP